MKRHDQIRYSDSFRRHVVDELESGRFASMSAAKRHYGNGGWNTIPGWLSKDGKNHLLPKVVIVQRPNEKDQIRELRRQKQELEQALGQMQLQNMISEKRLEIACEELGVEVEAFKKKRIGKVPTKSTKNKA